MPETKRIDTFTGSSHCVRNQRAGLSRNQPPTRGPARVYEDGDRSDEGIERKDSDRYLAASECQGRYLSEH